MNNKTAKYFISGMIVGMLVTLLISLLVINKRIEERTIVVDNSDKGVAEKTQTILNYIDAYYMGDYDINEVYEKSYAGIINGLGDIYSAYFTAEEYKAFEEDTSGTFVGVGSYISIDTETSYPCLVRPIKDGPADKAGLKAGDILIEVDGEDCYGMDLDLVVSKVKGEPNTKVELTIYREGCSDYLHFTITRAEVSVVTVEYKLLENNIGYVQVSNFAEKTAEQFSAAIDDLKKQGMKSLIIDLRNNPGGYVTTAIDMCDKILPADKIVTYTKDKRDNKYEYKTKDKDEVKMPIAVLINKNSASSSEIFTGCLKDYKKITIFGEKSYGKGIVQSIYGLSDGSKLKLTSAYFYSPNGTNIHGTGFEPDVPVDDDLETEEDEVLEKAKEYLSK